MKTKTTFLAMAMAAILWLFANSAVLSQEIIKNPAALKLHSKTINFHHNAQEHFNAFLGQTRNGQSLPNKNVQDANYRVDTLFKYSISSGSEKVINLYNNAGKVLSTLEQFWLINEWANKKITTSAYDTDGNLLSETIQLWQNITWVNQNLFTFTYDSYGNCMTETRQDWDGASWVNRLLTEFTYDNNGNILSELIKEWDGTDWMNVNLDVVTYDDAGNCLTYLNRNWDGTDWVNNSLGTCTYDSNGNMLSDLLQFWNGEDWDNYWIAEYTNDDNGNRLTSLEKMWEDAWLNFYSDTLSYDENGNYIAYTNYNSWDGETWEPYSHGSATYNASGNMLNFMHQMWNWGGVWENSDNVEYTYQDGVITADAYMWEGTFWTPGDSYFSVKLNDNGNKIDFFSGGPAVEVVVHYSSGNVGIDDPIKDQYGYIKVGPNPTTDYLEIVLSKPNLSVENLQLYNLAGNEIPVTWSNNRADMKNLPNGLYLLLITTSEGELITKRIVKQ